MQRTEEDELDDEAEWIYQQAFCKPPISKQVCVSVAFRVLVCSMLMPCVCGSFPHPSHTTRPHHTQPYFYTEKHRSASQRGRPQSTVPKIKEALNFMRNHFFEVPFIANYRKEYVKPELDLHDLWKIWLWDEKVCVGEGEGKHL